MYCHFQGFSRNFFIVFLFILIAFTDSFSQELLRIKHFGNNKGHLKMFVHTPLNINKTKPSPLVVVLHGCLQCAESAAQLSGWNKLADEYGFYVLYPQQRRINNPERCFKWYRSKHINKNSGENYSILQMVEYMKNNNSIDSQKVFITGLSAGAAMSVIMMADYPETFNSGAIFAGVPYKAAASLIPAVMVFAGWRIKSPEKWSKLIRAQNPDYKGEYPSMIIYQGSNDWIVNKRNGVELMKQWTSLYHISTQPSETITSFVNCKDIERNTYKSPEKKDAVIFYKVNKLSHALLIDPGECKTQGGKSGLFSKDKNYFSTLWTAYDFGLIPTPEIAGKVSAAPNQQNITFTVPLTANSTYRWTFPTDCTVVKNENTNSITINWGTASGCINVIETDSSNCRKQYKTLFVNLITNE